MLLNGSEIPERNARGERVVDRTFLLLFNAHYEPVTFKLPTRRFGPGWTFVLSTAEPDREEATLDWVARAALEVEARSVLVLRREP